MNGDLSNDHPVKVSLSGMSTPASYIFPAAFMANTFAMTAMMIALGLAGMSELAADFGIVHAATLALFYAFSANARSTILNPSSGVSAHSILGTRLLLMLPVGGITFLLCAQPVGVDFLLAFVLVLRRCAEWVGEIRVSEMELRSECKPAARFLFSQVLTTLAVVGWLLADLPGALLIIFVWAMSPLWGSLNLLLESAGSWSVTDRTWLKQSLHFGSTAIIGISVYVFRLLILLLVGRRVAGDLYTAFAVGGIMGTVFAQAIGPTLVLQELRGAATRFPVWLRAAIGLSVLCGATLFLTAAGRPDQMLWTGKSGFFWIAMGLSLIGGPVMVVAQRMRLRILQRHVEKDVFGPDVLANILVIASVPYGYYLFGMEALAFLYLVSAVLNLICYFSAAKSADLWSSELRSWAEPVRIVIVLMLLLPLFFQLTGDIFRNATYPFDTQGLLTRLPIPVSVLACYGGIVLLGGFERTHMSLTVIFFTFALMLASSVLLTHEHTRQEQAKLILLLQFVLPMFALVLGQMFDATANASSVLPRVFLFTVSALAPVQLAVTWLQGKVLLSPYLYLFSVYQLYEYVSVMFAVAYLISLFSLWDVHRYRLVLLTMSIPVSIFIAASMSALAIGALIIGILGFAVYRMFCGWGTRQVLVLCIAVGISVLSYFSIVANTGAFADKYKKVSVEGLESPRNVAQRLVYWRFYAGEVFDNAKSAVFGHVASPDRTQYPSAHNYYLDFAYHFGLIALLPLLGLVTLTLVMVYRNWGAILVSPSLLGLTAVVLFLLLVDNSLKVGMRQPYPGILTFFLWGVLLTELSRGSQHTVSVSSS
jgi:hypothetical protein